MTEHWFRNILLACTMTCAAALPLDAAQTYYVASDATADADGLSWANPTTLEKALTATVAGDQIWMKGYDNATIDDVYTTPEYGFTLRSGVKLYGGFKGDETSIDQRKTDGDTHKMVYRSILSGDVLCNDIPDNTKLFFPENTTRDDNALHVLTLDMTPGADNNNNYPTVVDGLTIINGNAHDNYGGGIFVTGDNTGGGIFVIERCFLLNNYALTGAGIYIGANIRKINNNSSSISQCAVYNNIAGTLIVSTNSGGGIYMAGEGTLVNTIVHNNVNGGVYLSQNAAAVNCTVARNSGSGIDGQGAVYNSVIWGNTLLSISSESRPQFNYSAYPEVLGEPAGTNTYLSDKNNDSAGPPAFSAPATHTGYDRSINPLITEYSYWSWNPQQTSVLIDKGNNDYYNDVQFGAYDHGGYDRVRGTIDIGAYEYQPIEEGRMRYVKAGAAGSGMSWDDASGDLQKMIDELADNNPLNLAGEVWVAEGTYIPQSQLVSGTNYSASFRMRDGISVFGGFKGDETRIDQRVRTKGKPWIFDHETILQASYFGDNLEWNNNKWTLNSESRHVVWFAPMSGEEDFERLTTLDGVTVRGGYAQGGSGLDDFKTDRGGGVYAASEMAQIHNCTFKENYAAGKGGAIYLSNGRVVSSLVYNNNSDSDGGGIYIDTSGIVLRSLVTNNSAENGAGIYLKHNPDGTSELNRPEYLIVSTSVVANNTSRHNGAVYCDKGGVLMQSTVVNNQCTTSTDQTAENASRTGGVYIDEYAIVTNSILWNNRIRNNRVPIYAKNPTAEKVRFINNAVANVNNAIWNNILQQGTVLVADSNMEDENFLSPDFMTGGQMPDNESLLNNVGVQSAWKDSGIDYFWEHRTGSNMRSRGMILGNLPSEIPLTPEIDINNRIFSQNPPLGAYVIDPIAINHETTAGAITVYVDVKCTDPTHDGSSWAQGYRSLNEAIDYMASLGEAVIGSRELEILVLEGSFAPHYAYINEDPKSATIRVVPMPGGRKLTIRGGYRLNADGQTAEWNPQEYRTTIDGNTQGKDITEGLYHCLTVMENANVEIDGLHIVNGYAAGEANRHYGAGVLVRENADLTLRNCAIENNTAMFGAAIATTDDSATLTLINSVVNNNTNTETGQPVISCPEDKLTLRHVTVANNIGTAPTDLGTSSFAAGNSAGNSLPEIPVTSETFSNPTNKPGASLGFDTYYGGYAEFRPLTSSAVAAAQIINKAAAEAGITQDIAGKDRDLGGKPDKGAWEASLPESGRVFYVRMSTEGGNDGNSGLSWDEPLASVQTAVNKAFTQPLVDGKRAQVWVAAGTYSRNPDSSSDNCYEIKEGVDVFGAFPKTGTPGMDDRQPFISTSVPNITDYDPANYETILQPATTTQSGTGRRRVLGQPNSYNPAIGSQDFEIPTTWDGFTLTKGYVWGFGMEGITGQMKRNGGAGAAIFKNATLKNCIITGNKLTGPTRQSNWTNVGYPGVRGGGVYCDKGTLINCYITDNILGDNGNSSTQTRNLHSAYGGGCYMFNGTAYNCIISGNSTFANNAEGAGIFIENAKFYNNTIVNNTSTASRWSGSKATGGIGIYNSGGGSTLTIYNCIVMGNTGGKNATGNKDISTSGGVINCYNSIVESDTNAGSGSSAVNYYECTIRTNTSELFTDYTGGNYRLRSTDGTNIGEDAPMIDGETVYLMDFTDMDFTDRIKDCRVDAGAYERDNSDHIDAEVVGDTYIYYVTHPGAGSSIGNSPENAACAMKLQDVLNAAGEKVVETGGTVIVKIAGYEGAGSGDSFVYNATDLGNPNDPISYTFTVPYGVIVKGGYNAAVDRAEKNGWDDDQRNAAEFATTLSAIKVGSGSTPEVNGYHVVTFAEPADGQSGKLSVIDGLHLIDGKATSMAGGGNLNTRGGAAIVPAWAHVRNCIVRNCEAVTGGAFYMMPRATISGTVVRNNSATQAGGGIYIDNENVDAATRAHIVSCTITDNTAEEGGGIFLEDESALVFNTVVWGNSSPSDKNISGVGDITFLDDLMEALLPGKIQEYYPFNNCHVETFELPGNYHNMEMISDETIYFSHSRTLKPYSPLVKHGMEVALQESFEKNTAILPYDITGMLRMPTDINTKNVDAGAFAFDGATMPIPTSIDDVITRIFVSQNNNETPASETDESLYIGRSFLSSVTWIEDALEYITQVRTLFPDTEFEILVAEGTYKPKYRRIDAATEHIDQRQNSFVVPKNVRIYGGFSGTELYSTGIASFPTAAGDIALIPDGDIDGILQDRQFSDLNGNTLLEPWEFANQTIFSGRINISATERNVYHVVFSNDTSGEVTLDGISVMNGETLNYLSYDTDENEIGRGGGLYTNGVSYTVNRCRFISNYAMRGGAIFSRNARLVISSSLIAGNGTVDNPQVSADTPAGGGGVYIASWSVDTNPASLHAVNSLWVNNETVGQGGAIAAVHANHFDGTKVSLLNNTLARNKAKTNATFFIDNAESKIHNTLLWGNEQEEIDKDSYVILAHSASDNELAETSNGNIRISSDNMAIDGPRFTRPSTTAGIAGYNDTYLWNPTSISILSDSGDGTLATDGTETGAYEEWFRRFSLPDLKDCYIMHPTGSYARYSGPNNDDGSVADKTVDIGFYEYQYRLDFSTMDAIYVATEEVGLADGTSWANATSDLRGALIGLANPESSWVRNKQLYIRDGEYSWRRLATGTAYIIDMSDNELIDKVTVNGACTGVGKNQNFSNPTIITSSDNLVEEGGTVGTDRLMAISANNKELEINGISFRNKDTRGLQTGISVSTKDNGKVTLKNVSFRGNKTAVEMDDCKQLKVVNTLFADGLTGIGNVNGTTTLVNTTFANLTNADVTFRNGIRDGFAAYNSVSWINGTQNIEETEQNGNTVIDGAVDNSDITAGPNFTDPANSDIYSRNYRIRPSLTLLNRGANALYLTHALDGAADFPEDETDLYNLPRMTDGTIDIGAYEYPAPMQPIVYVKADLTAAADGKSWATALGDLQGAVDLAAIYANNRPGRKGYVFVHNNMKTGEPLKIGLPNVSVYGTMNDETSSLTLGESHTEAEVEAIVDEILGKRRGLIEDASKSELRGPLTVDGAGSTVDGFRILGNTAINKGAVSTSIVESAVGGTADGLLYNSLADGSVTGVRTVNVTATGTLPDDALNSRKEAVADNAYVTDNYWAFQLMETSADIDAATASIDDCIALVRHNRDIAGNLRKRTSDAVDNGCFETWNINTDNREVTAADYPHGKSVVYIRTGRELLVGKNGTQPLYANAKPFSPGFILLEHHAGLRGNGNYINLTNVAMERNVPSGGFDMAIVPFAVGSVSGNDNVTASVYQGDKRAAFSYKYTADDNAWLATGWTLYANRGFLMENTGTEAATVRFSNASAYTENPNGKYISLVKYNFNEPWTTDSDGNTLPDGSQKFTHKENMSWNLTGSPFLCAMNYADMDYGRIIYGLEGNAYRTVNTMETTAGHIPAGDAFFTQTATLKISEDIAVRQPTGTIEGTPYQLPKFLALKLNAGNTGGGADLLTLNAVDNGQATSDYVINADGVKWGVDNGNPQIYAARNGGRYSLLAAVDRESSVALGTKFATAGVYTIDIFDLSDADGYEAVVLTDRLTRQSVDLKEAPYTFTVAEAGDDDGNRFSVAFKGIASPDDLIRVWSPARGMLKVAGMDDGAMITVYAANGMLLQRRFAAAFEESFSMPQGVYLVEVEGADSKTTKKAIVR